MYFLSSMGNSSGQFNNDLGRPYLTTARSKARAASLAVLCVPRCIFLPSNSMEDSNLFVLVDGVTPLYPVLDNTFVFLLLLMLSNVLPGFVDQRVQFEFKSRVEQSKS